MERAPGGRGLARWEVRTASQTLAPTLTAKPTQREEAGAGSRPRPAGPVPPGWVCRGEAEAGKGSALEGTNGSWQMGPGSHLTVRSHSWLLVQNASEDTAASPGRGGSRVCVRTPRGDGSPRFPRPTVRGASERTGPTRRRGEDPAPCAGIRPSDLPGPHPRQAQPRGPLPDATQRPGVTRPLVVPLPPSCGPSAARAALGTRGKTPEVGWAPCPPPPPGTGSGADRPGGTVRDAAQHLAGGDGDTGACGHTGLRLQLGGGGWTSAPRRGPSAAPQAAPGCPSPPPARRGSGPLRRPLQDLSVPPLGGAGMAGLPAERRVLRGGGHPGES